MSDKEADGDLPAASVHPTSQTSVGIDHTRRGHGSRETVLTAAELMVLLLQVELVLQGLLGVINVVEGVLIKLSEIGM